MLLRTRSAFEAELRVAESDVDAELDADADLGGEALEVAYCGKNPALAAMDAHEKHVAPVPPQARELLANLKKGITK